MSTREIETKLTVRGVDKLTAPFGKMGKASGSLGKEVKKHLGRLNEMRGPVKMIEDFRKTSKELRKSASDSAAAKKKVEGLASAYRKAENPTRKMREELDKARRAASRANGVYEKNLGLFRERKGLLEQNGMSLKDLAKHEREYAAVIKETSAAQEKSWAAFKKQNERKEYAQKAKDKFRDGMGLATGMAATGYSGLYTGRRILSGLKNPIDEAANFQDVMLGVKAVTRTSVTSNMTEEVRKKRNAQFKALRDQALGLGESTSFTNVQAGQAQHFLGMAGMEVPEILASMPSVLDLSKAGRTDLARTADIASNIMSGYGLKGKDMGRIADVMVGTFTRANVNVSQIGETMKYVGPKAKEAGLSLEYVAAATGKLGDAGIQGSMAGTALRSVISRLAGPPKMAQKALDRLGVKTKDLNGNLRPFEELLDEIHGKMQKLGSAERIELTKKIAGEEGSSAFTVLLNQRDAIRKLRDELKGAKGEASEIAKVMSDGAKGEEKLLGSAWSALQTEVGTQLLPAYRGLLETTTSWLTAMREWAAENPGIVKAMAGTAAVVGGIAVAAGGAAFAMAGLAGTFVMLRYGGSLLRLAKGLDKFSGSLAGFSGKADKAAKSNRRLGRSFGGLGKMGLLGVGLTALGVSEQSDKFNSMTPEERKGLANKQDDWAANIPAIGDLYSWTKSVREGMFGEGGDLISFLTSKDVKTGQQSGELELAKQSLKNLNEEIERTRAGAVNAQSADMLVAPLVAEKTALLEQIETLSASVAQSGLDDAVKQQADGVVNSGLPQSLQILAARVGSLHIPSARFPAAAPPQASIQPTSSGLAPASAGQQVANVPVNVQVHAAPGMDEEKVAQVVTDKIGQVVNDALNQSYGSSSFA
ncbi:MAG: phage tail tape measure protein [Cohaesibacter sp.]|nr:phage tail tape measure protein [Cohaesibacter sp.]